MATKKATQTKHKKRINRFSACFHVALDCLCFRGIRLNRCGFYGSAYYYYLNLFQLKCIDLVD